MAMPDDASNVPRDADSDAPGPLPDAIHTDAPPGSDGPQSLVDAGPIDGPVGVATHILLTEIVVAPAAAEMIEIYNPTNAAVDLSSYYLADRADYYTIVTGSVTAVSTDFIAHFPSGSMIQPGQYQTIALHGTSMFMTTYGIAPTYEIAGDSAAVPDMLPAVTGSIGGPTTLTLTDTGEPVILFQWDQAGDLVKDVDYVYYGTVSTANPQVNKTGIAIDGPDVGTTTSTYAADSAAQSPIGTHNAGGSIHRCRFDEGGETMTGGNGITGHNETSEPMNTTWKVNTSTTTLRTPNAGPPAGFCP
jgi:lamin tail-like protein